jgi:ribosomal protein L13
VTYWTSQEDDNGNVTDVGAVAGMVSSAVKAIRCDTSRDTFTYDVDSPVGAFVIVIENADNVELTAIDAAGNDLGVPVRI